MNHHAYHAPKTVQDAVRLLASGRSRVIAGGTDLMLDMKEDAARYDSLVDITGIEAANIIALEDGCLRVGACCPFARLERDPLVRRHAEALAMASGHVGSPQIRTVATPGGNVVNAMPAADAALALFALNARVETAGPDGVRVLPIGDCYAGRGQSVINAEREFITAFLLPVAQGGLVRKSTFERFALRKSLALPVVAAAVCLTFEEGKARQARVVLGPVGSAPWHARRAEEYLTGKELSAEVMRQGAQLAAEDATFRDSPVRCTARYKKKLAQTIVRDALAKASGWPKSE